VFSLASGGPEIVKYQQKKQPIEINPEFRKALDVMEDTNRHVFITGKAGTGKSTLLDYFRKSTSKDVAVLAPTGVAALNIQGQTIHSFFGFKPNVTPDKIKKVTGKEGHIYKEFDTIIIDEISMVRADLLDSNWKRFTGKQNLTSLPFSMASATDPAPRKTWRG